MSFMLFNVFETNLHKRQSVFHLRSGVFKANGSLRDVLLPAAEHVDPRRDQSPLSCVEQHHAGGELVSGFINDSFTLVLSKRHLVRQDYGNALRVQVRGQATLRLLTDKPAIKMDSQTREVSGVHL